MIRKLCINEHHCIYIYVIIGPRESLGMYIYSRCWRTHTHYPVDGVVRKDGTVRQYICYYTARYANCIEIVLEQALYNNTSSNVIINASPNISNKPLLEADVFAVLFKNVRKNLLLMI